MTSFFKTSLHFDLNEATKCVDMPLTFLASLSRTRKKYKMVTTFGLTYDNSFTCYWQLEMSQLGKNLRLMLGGW